jgi:hypothetical protein
MRPRQADFLQSAPICPLTLLQVAPIYVKVINIDIETQP